MTISPELIQTTSIQPSLGNPEDTYNEVNPRYNLTDTDEFSELSDEMIEKVVNAQTNEGVHSVWLSPRHPYSNIVRTLEAELFPEIPDVMNGFEDDCQFLALVDTRPGIKRLVHAFRLSWPGFGKETVEDVKANPMDIVMLHDIVNSGQGLNADDIARYYTERGINLAQCLSVESNFRIGEKVHDPNGLPASQLGYIALFDAVAKGKDVKRSAIFAHLNRVAKVSLAGVGVEYEPIAGIPDLKTPTVDINGNPSFDAHYEPVCIPSSPKNLEVFGNLSVFAVPVIEV